MKFGSAEIAAIAAVLGLVLVAESRWAALDERWARWSGRLEGPETAEVVVMRLHGDVDGSTQDRIVENLNNEGIQTAKAAYRWTVGGSREDNREEREKHLEKIGKLVMVTGRLGGDGAEIESWSKSGQRSEVVVWKRKKDTRVLLTEVERALVDGLRYEAWRKRHKILQEPTGTNVAKRARSIRRKMGEGERRRDVDWTIAYIENIRADGTGGDKSSRVANRIYDRLLKSREDKDVATLTNLGLAKQREARQSRNAEELEGAVRLWREAEEKSEGIQHLQRWQLLRLWRAEAERDIAEWTGSTKRAADAERLVIETYVDSAGMMPVWIAEAMWRTLVQTREIAGGKNGDGEKTERRAKRLQDRINGARENGLIASAAQLTSSLATLWREEGIQQNDASWLVASFHEVNVYRIWSNNADSETETGRLEIGIPQMYEYMDTEVNVAMTCKDMEHINRLRSGIQEADLWCDRVTEDECKRREEWREEVMQELGEMAGEIALDTRRGGEEPHSLCPNRQRGLGEEENQRGNRKIRELTEQVAEMDNIEGCSLPRRSWEVTPMALRLTSDDDLEWLSKVNKWSKKREEELMADIKKIRVCIGR